MIATPKNWLKAQLGYGFGAQFRPWVGLDWARDYSDLFYHRGASQGSARGWLNPGLDLRLNSAWLGLALARWVSAQLCLGSFRLVSDQF